jgi:hypothetical protein
MACACCPSSLRSRLATAVPMCLPLPETLKAEWRESFASFGRGEAEAPATGPDDAFDGDHSGRAANAAALRALRKRRLELRPLN